MVEELHDLFLQFCRLDLFNRKYVLPEYFQNDRFVLKFVESLHDVRLSVVIQGFGFTDVLFFELSNLNSILIWLWFLRRIFTFWCYVGMSIIIHGR